MSLDLKNVSVRWANSSTLFGPLCVCVERGEVATVMGPSGVGKSTLLDAIAGHLASTFQLEGHITLNGIDLRSLPPEARRIGLMFQDGGLFPHLSVGDNLAFGLTRTVVGRARRHAAVEVARERQRVCASSGCSRRYASRSSRPSTPTCRAPASGAA